MEQYTSFDDELDVLEVTKGHKIYEDVPSFFSSYVRGISPPCGHGTVASCSEPQMVLGVVQDIDSAGFREERTQGPQLCGTPSVFGHIAECR